MATLLTTDKTKPKMRELNSVKNNLRHRVLIFTSTSFKGILRQYHLSTLQGKLKSLKVTPQSETVHIDYSLMKPYE